MTTLAPVRSTTTTRLPDPGRVSWWRQPVPVAIAVAGGLHLIWGLLLATNGGDIAAQDAWAEFAKLHPGSAYSLSWYGGMHPVSYSIVSPYVMAVLGVRTTMVLAGTVSAGLLAWMLQHSRYVKRPMWAAVYGAVALSGNAISGRVTFALGAVFALVAISLTLLVFEQPERRTRNLLRLGVGLSGGLATASSPVAGLFLGLVAVAAFLLRRRADAYALGIPPAVVVAASTLLFPFSGEEPMNWVSVILPLIVTLCVVVLVPSAWHIVRWSAGVYAVAIVAAWLLPSPVGTNIVRLGLLFGGVVLVAAATSDGWRTSWLGSRFDRKQACTLVAMAIITATAWQVGVASLDAVFSRPPVASQAGIDRLVAQLRSRHAELERVEVVPTRNHSEMAALAPYVALARGWNRQADVDRNPIFYKRTTLSPKAYHHWLKNWAVGYVVLSDTEPDHGAATEAAVVRSHPSYLHEVWSGGGWTLYSVLGSQPLVDAPAKVVAFDPAQLTISTPVAGQLTVRVPSSPWLALVDSDGHPLPDTTQGGPCLSEVDKPNAKARGRNWVVLHATTPGTYRISAPYKLPRGSACPSP